MKDVDYTQLVGGTKFLLAFGAACTCTVLVWFGKIDQLVFRDVVLGCVGAYIAGNVVQRIKEAAINGGAPK